MASEAVRQKPAYLIPVPRLQRFDVAVVKTLRLRAGLSSCRLFEAGL
jgi:hypothetical protein